MVYRNQPYLCYTNLLVVLRAEICQWLDQLSPCYTFYRDLNEILKHTINHHKLYCSLVHCFTCLDVCKNRPPKQKVWRTSGGITCCPSVDARLTRTCAIAEALPPSTRPPVTLNIILTNATPAKSRLHVQTTCSDYMLKLA